MQSETDEMNPSSAQYSLSTLDGNEGYFKGTGGGEAKWSVGLGNKEKRPDFNVVIGVHARLLKCLFQTFRWLLISDHCPCSQAGNKTCRKQNSSHKAVICRRAEKIRLDETKNIKGKRFICFSSPKSIQQSKNKLVSK